MENRSISTTKHKLIPSESISEWFFIVLVCYFWAEGLFGFAFVCADKILGTGLFIRTFVKTFLVILFAIGSLDYYSRKVRFGDILIVFLFLLLYFLAPAASFIPALEYENFTSHFIWALPLYLVGVSIDFPKIKNLLLFLTIVTIIVSAYYHLVFIHGSTYAGSAETEGYDMVGSYSFLLPTMYVLWSTFADFNIKTFSTWASVVAALVGIFAILMLGTRGPLIAIGLFVALYFLLFKLHKHKFLCLLLFSAIACIFILFSEAIFSFFAELAINLGFSDRIFESFLSGDNLLTEGSSGRDEFYPILFNALNNSPIIGYGFWGSYEFIHTYPHNLFMEIIFSFGYFLGGFIILFGFFTTIRAIRNDLTDDEKGFLFVLFCGGIIGLLFSSSFIITPVFYFFLGFCIQMAYRKKSIR